MTFTTHAAMNHVQRLADRARRLKTLKMREATMLRRYGVTHGNDGHAGSIRINMHITPWWTDENGIPTRQIWAKGSVIER